MRVRLNLHVPVLPEVIGKKRLDVEFDGSTLSDLLDHLLVRYGRGARSALYDEAGELDPVVQLVVNGKSWVTREGLDTELQDGDEVTILTLLAGG
jgi:molybdopterin synthase sulfur carrier subunit